MEWEKSLKVLYGIQIVLLLSLSVVIYRFSPEKAASFYLFEVIGALLASTVTVFGLQKMKATT